MVEGVRGIQPGLAGHGEQSLAPRAIRGNVPHSVTTWETTSRIPLGARRRIGLLESAVEMLVAHADLRGELLHTSR
jgi:hypothetical protein